MCEVLVRELLTIDGLATGALDQELSTHSYDSACWDQLGTHIVTGEITSLEHEIGNHTVEC